jgi:hypothetical protein
MKLRLAGTVKRLNFLVNPSYETSQGQSFFLDYTGRFSGQRRR